LQVLVDTSVWSLALRRAADGLTESENQRVAALRELIQDNRVRIIGPIRQEILSGIRAPAQFNKLRDQLRAFPDEVLTARDFEDAAHWTNECRRKGVVGSTTGLLICAVSISRRWQVLTGDADFVAYSKAIPLQIFDVG
jgi:predicted nucleic acid-binding protein